MSATLQEQFTAAERERLSPHFSNLDGSVFALMNLPETVKAAMFARYSRYGGTLRRLFLDEFAEGLPPAGGGLVEGARSKRTEDLFERVFLGYGDDSVAQLGGAHIACEWSSNLLTKILQRPRLGAYLEQSTRYIAFDRATPSGRYRYYQNPLLGAEYERAMDRIFTIYSQAIEPLSASLATAYPQTRDVSDAAHARAVRAKALDLLRGLLPASSLSHVGIFASGQTYEQLIMHLAAHPLLEARECGTMMLTAVSEVMPSFVTRIARRDRGGAWIDQLRARSSVAAGVAHGLHLEDSPSGVGPSVRLLEVRGDEAQLLAAMLFEATAGSELQLRARVSEMSRRERMALITELVGVRANRRHRPNRGFEAVSYRFEIVSDYGAFRDLQRHRMLTVQWQGLTGDLGAEVPNEVVAAGQGELYSEALRISRATWVHLTDAGAGPAAAYALCLAFRVRYVLDLNAREAMHVIELRSGVQGHPSYRAVALEMYRLIEEIHPTIAAAMGHVDRSSEPRLERLISEIRGDAARRAER
jgi:thymidylate synthase ThyX